MSFCASPPAREKIAKSSFLILAEKSCRERQLKFVLFPQLCSGRLRQVNKRDPHIASGRTGEVFTPNMIVLLREVGVVAVGVECLRINQPKPKNETAAFC